MGGLLLSSHSEIQADEVFIIAYPSMITKARKEDLANFALALNAPNSM